MNNQITKLELTNAQQWARVRARTVARSQPHWVDGEVLENEAALALERARATYDRRQGVAFNTWVGAVVNRALADEIRRQSPWTRNQRRDRRENMAAGLEPEGWMLPPIPLCAPAETGEEDGAALEDTLPGPDNWGTTDAALLVPQLLAQLEERRAEVVRRYYLEGESSAQIAASLGVSVARVQQLRGQALERLRAHLAAPLAEAPADPQPWPLRLEPREQPAAPIPRPVAGLKAFLPAYRQALAAGGLTPASQSLYHVRARAFAEWLGATSATLPEGAIQQYQAHRIATGIRPRTAQAEAYMVHRFVKWVHSQPRPNNQPLTHRQRR